MRDCCEKIINKKTVGGAIGKNGSSGQNGPPGPPGPPGPDGEAPTRYFQSYGETSLSDEGDPFVFTVTQPGDYVLQFNAYATRVDPGAIWSYLVKNGVLQVANVNGFHQNTELISISETVFTHNAKLTGVIAGDSIGFSVSDPMAATSLLVNASLTILKLT